MSNRCKNCWNYLSVCKCEGAIDKKVEPAIVYLRDPVTGNELEGAAMPQIGSYIDIRVGYVIDDLVSKFHAPEEWWGGFLYEGPDNQLSVQMEPPPIEKDGTIILAPWPQLHEIVAWRYFTRCK